MLQELRFIEKFRPFHPHRTTVSQLIYNMYTFTILILKKIGIENPLFPETKRGIGSGIFQVQRKGCLCLGEILRTSCHSVS